MSINLFCYTELSCEKATLLNKEISKDALFLNEHFLIYKVDKYCDSLRDIGIFIDDYNPVCYFLIYLKNKSKGEELRYVSNLIYNVYNKNILILYENEIIWNKPCE